MDKGFINLSNDYISAAHNYVCSAEALLLVDQDFFQKKRCGFIDVITQTLGQAAEVILKAALASKAHPKFSSITQSGIFKCHDLKLLIKECEEYSVVIDLNFKTHSEAISENYNSHDFRYPRSFYGFTASENDYLNYMRTGEYKGNLETLALKEIPDNEKNNMDKYKKDDEIRKILKKKMEKQGLVVKSRTSNDKYVAAIKKQIEIVSNTLEEVEKC